MKKAALRYAELLEKGFFVTQQEQDDIAKLLRKLVMTEDEAWDEMEARLNKPKEKSTVSKPWVSLTDDEAYQLLVDYCDDDLGLLSAIEAALRSKNNG